MTDPTPVQLVDNRTPGVAAASALWFLGDRYLLDPWVATLIIGAAHHWWASVPSISFPHTWLLLLLSRILVTPPLTVLGFERYKWKS